MTNSEELRDVVTVFSIGDSSLAAIIPKSVCKDLGVKKGDRLSVKIDEKGRILYEKIGRGK